MCVKVERHGKKMVANYYSKSGEVVACGVARCNPTDKFDFVFGMALATRRALKSVRVVNSQKRK